MKKILLLGAAILTVILMLVFFGGKKIVSPLPSQPMIREMFEPKVKRSPIIKEENKASPTGEKEKE